MNIPWWPGLTLALLLGACAAPPVQTATTAPACEERGLASCYTRAPGQTRMADGELLDPRALTAAHPSLPFGTMVRVTDLDTGRSVVVRITDRGPVGHGRIIDLSAAAARALAMKQAGVAPVRLEIDSPAAAASAATATPAIATAPTACLLPHTTQS